jgi:hypothetical protein
MDTCVFGGLDGKQLLGTAAVKGPDKCCSIKKP